MKSCGFAQRTLRRAHKERCAVQDTQPRYERIDTSEREYYPHFFSVDLMPMQSVLTGVLMDRQWLP